MQTLDRIGRRLKLRDLNIFVVTVKERSMSKAATVLAVSQPAISKAIADMERSLGAPLLDRTSHGVEPTLYGRALLTRAFAVFDELRHCVEDIDLLLDPTIGEVRLGCTEPLAAGLVPHTIEAINRQHPRISFQVLEAGFATLQRQLRDREIEVLLGRAPAAVSDEDLVSEVLFEDRLLVVAGSSNKWLRRSRIDFSELLTEPWVLPQRGTIAASLVDEAFRSLGFAPPTAIGSASMAFNIHLLAGGRFLSLLPQSMVHFSAKRLPLHVLEVDLPLRLRPLLIVTLKNRALSSPALLFIQRVRSAIELLTTTATAEGSTRKAVPKRRARSRTSK